MTRQGHASLTVVILRDGRHADADGGLLGDRMDGVGAVDVGEGEAEVLLHGAQAEVFGVQINLSPEAFRRSCAPLCCHAAAAASHILWLGTNLLDPQTEVEDAVWRVALPAGPAHLPDKPGQSHVQLLRAQRQQVTFRPSCKKPSSKPGLSYCDQLSHGSEAVIGFILPGLVPSFTLVSSDWSELDRAQRFQALMPYLALRGSDRPSECLPARWEVEDEAESELSSTTSILFPCNTNTPVTPQTGGREKPMSSSIPSRTGPESEALDSKQQLLNYLLSSSEQSDNGWSHHYGAQRAWVYNNRYNRSRSGSYLSSSSSEPLLLLLLLLLLLEDSSPPCSSFTFTGFTSETHIQSFRLQTERSSTVVTLQLDGVVSGGERRLSVVDGAVGAHGAACSQAVEDLARLNQRFTLALRNTELNELILRREVGRNYDSAAFETTVRAEAAGAAELLEGLAGVDLGHDGSLHVGDVPEKHKAQHRSITAGPASTRNLHQLVKDRLSQNLK
ncbi:hypothetical protein INR49_026971, partial [Caranx melampygus]